MKTLYVTKKYLYVYEDGRVIRKDFSFEKGIVTSSVGYNHILNLTFKLPKDLDQEMLEVEAEKYIFTEGSLDYSKEYKINYFFKEYDDYYNVEAFIIEVNVLKREYDYIVKTFKYIDFISPKPFVFKSYYDITGVKPQNDAFIYFDKNEAFLSCFENGEFVFVKSLTKMSSLASQLSMKLEDVENLLIEKGLDEAEYEDNNYGIVESFFSQLFMKVSNLINYSSSYYGLNKIDRLYFYSPFEIKSLFENYESFWSLSGIEFKKYQFETDYDCFDYTACVYNSKYYIDENQNFSIFPKPLPFYKTKTGILLNISLVCTLLIGADAVYKINQINKKEEEVLKLKKRISRIQREERLVKTAVKKYRDNVLRIKKENEAIRKQIDDIADKITYLRNIYFKRLTANQIADLTGLLKKYNLKLSSFVKEGNIVKLYIVSGFDNSSDIAKFMKGLYKLGYKNISSNEIKNEKGLFIAEVSYEE